MDSKISKDKNFEEEEKRETEQEKTEPDELTIEPTESDEANQTRKLREKLKVCVALKQEYMEGWQRAKADLINARRRDEEERKEFIKFANESIVTELLPTLDSFEAAIAQRDFWEKAPKEWRAGMENISAQLKAALAGAGLKEYSPLGEKFNPASHTAVSSVKEEGTEEGIIVKVAQKGYMLGEKLIRPPKVVVSE